MAAARLLSCVPLLGLSLTCASLTSASLTARAASLVVPGYGAAEAARAQGYDGGPVYAQTPFPPAPPAGGPAAYARVAAPAPVVHGTYGGGFIELLMDHGSPPAPVIYNQPPGRAIAYDPPAGYAPARPQALATRGVVYDPLETEPRAERRSGPSLDGRPRAISALYERQEVAYAGPEKPGTVVIDTPRKFLFLVQPGGRALRYGIGVGRPGFEWAGVKSVSRKAEWPGWTPPSDMLRRRPDLPRHMDGGPANPLGARALYLGSSLYRIHGTNEPSTIGQNVSSGCIRMMNEDVIDLYNRVPVGTRVIVM